MIAAKLHLQVQSCPAFSSSLLGPEVSLWLKRKSRSVFVCCPTGNLLYPLARTGPVFPAHAGDDQERVQAAREFLVDALCPAWPVAMLLRARRS